MKIIYRISEDGYDKVKPKYITNENCLKNFCKVFKDYIRDIYVIADNCSDNTINMIKNYVNERNIHQVSVGHGAGTFNLALDKALTWDNNEIVYFVENDYIHLSGSPKILEEGIKLRASYVSLYLHPDKFIPYLQGGNPEVDYDGGYLTKIYRGETQLFGIFNSSTMTFASTVRTIKEDENIFRKWTSGTHPHDFQMFLELREKGRVLLCPLNTFSSHGESDWLSPLSNIEKEDLIKEWRKFILK